MLITFTASLEGASPIKVDSDGGGRVTLTLPANDTVAIARLMGCMKRRLIVTITEEESANAEV